MKAHITSIKSTRRLFLILMAALAAIVGYAQNDRQDVFFVHRNDGQFNAFFYSEIDSITLSCYDADSVKYNRVVSQVFHTPIENVFIPIEAIDSVSFERPVTKYQPNVVRADENGMFDYLISADGLTLTFKKSMPTSLKPQQGQVLTYFKFDNAVLGYDVFAGKIKKVSDAANGIVTECEMLDDITDIYERLVGCDIINNDDKPTSRAIVGTDGTFNHTFSVNANPKAEFADKNRKLKLDIHASLEGELAVKMVYDIGVLHKYLAVTVDHDWKMGLGYNISKELHDNTTWKSSTELLIARAVAPAAPILSFDLYAAPFTKASGTLDLGQEFTWPRMRYKTMFIYNDGQVWNRSKDLPDEPGEDNDCEWSVKLALNGSMQTGICLTNYAGTLRFTKNYFGVQTNIFMGPQLSGSFAFELDKTEDQSRSLYSMIKDSSIDLNLAVNVSSELILRTSLTDEKKYTFFEGSLGTDPLSLHLLPEFSAPSVSLEEVEINSENFGMVHPPLKATMAKPQRTTLLPVYPGFILKDTKTGTKVSSCFSDKSYWIFNWDWATDEEVTGELDNWKVYTDYEVCPAFSFCGMEFEATPSSNKRIEPTASVYDSRTDTHFPGSIFHLIGKLYVGELFYSISFGDLGFRISTDKAEVEAGGGAYYSVFDGTKCASVDFSNSYEFKYTISVEPNTTYYFCAVARDIDGTEHQISNISSETTEEDDKIFDGVDLKLPSGLIWCDGPLRDSYFSGPRRIKKSEVETDPYYQVAHAQGWRLPTKEEALELVEYGHWENNYQDISVYDGKGGRAITVYEGTYMTSTEGTWSEADEANPYMESLNATYYPYDWVGKEVYYYISAYGGNTADGGKTQVCGNPKEFGEAENYVWLVKSPNGE